MEIKFIEFKSEEYKDTLVLRNAVLRRPLGINLSYEDIKGEDLQFHVGAFINGELVGCLVVCVYEKNKLKIRQVAVKPDYQKQGVGSGLINFVQDYAITKGIVSITLNSRVSAFDFYKKLGYVVVGEEFLALNLPHIKMEKALKN